MLFSYGFGVDCQKLTSWSVFCQGQVQRMAKYQINIQSGFGSSLSLYHEE